LSMKPGSAPAPPPPIPRGNGGTAPPPPPLGAGRSLRPKATTKLKRSTQLGNLYRTLKGKVEGSSLKGKSSGGRNTSIGAKSNGGKQGMADALAEMTKRYADHGFKLWLRLRFKLLYRGKM
jgi:Wiskott-Aldrich syndrome protein